MSDGQTAIAIRHEVKRLGSQNADRSLRWPDPQVFTWIKVPGMPWVLAGFEPYRPEATA